MFFILYIEKSRFWGLPDVYSVITFLLYQTDYQ